jgi:hypothetical protein
MTPSRLHINFWALWVFFFVVGLAVFVSGIRIWFLARKSAAWPRTTGQIVSIMEKSSPAHRGSVSGVEVLYEYVFAEQSHQGRRIAFGFVGGAARKKLEQMPKGDSIQVSVDPSDHSNSVMLPGVASATRIPAFIGLGIIGFTAILVLLVIRDPPWKVT